MFCSKCGNEVSGNDKYCPKCGTAIGEIAKEEKAVNINGVSMTADELVDFCIDNKFINLAEFGKNQTKKEWRIFFENIMGEIQSDETPLLCFAGNHNYKGKINTSGMHSYVLTNKRLITAGWYAKNSSGFNPVVAYTIIFKGLAQKHPKCSKESLYLRDVVAAKTNMVDGHDVITFDTVNGSFNVMFYNSNVTHELCDKINEILKQVKEK